MTPQVIWKKDVWLGDRWAYGRVVYVPTKLRDEKGVIFEVATERDAMDSPVWRRCDPFLGFIEEAALSMLNLKTKEFEESKALPPNNHGTG